MQPHPNLQLEEPQGIFPLPVRVLCSPRKVNLPPHFQVPSLPIHTELPLNFIPAPPRLPLHSPGPWEAFQERKWQTLSLFPAPPRCTAGPQGSLHPTRATPSTSHSVISSFATSANRGLSDSKQHALPFRIHEACFPLRYQLASGCVQELHCHTLPSNWLLVLMKTTDGRGTKSAWGVASAATKKTQLAPVTAVFQGSWTDSTQEITIWCGCNVC